jgi:hypothetical protein
MSNEEPDLQLAGLSIWGVRRAYPQSEDYWDGNWLNIQARVEAPGSRVEIAGTCLRSDDIARFRQQLEALYRDLRGTAALESMEPQLVAKVTVGTTGQIDAKIEITPDHMTQSHSFVFEIDQSYLATTLEQSRKLLARFPVKSSLDAR